MIFIKFNMPKQWQRSQKLSTHLQELSQEVKKEMMLVEVWDQKWTAESNTDTEAGQQLLQGLSDQTVLLWVSSLAWNSEI